MALFVFNAGADSSAGQDGASGRRRLSTGGRRRRRGESTGTTATTDRDFNRDRGVARGACGGGSGVAHDEPSTPRFHFFPATSPSFDEFEQKFYPPSMAAGPAAGHASAIGRASTAGSSSPGCSPGAPSCAPSTLSPSSQASASSSSAGGRRKCSYRQVPRKCWPAGVNQQARAQAHPISPRSAAAAEIGFFPRTSPQASPSQSSPPARPPSKTPSARAAEAPGSSNKSKRSKLGATSFLRVGTSTSSLLGPTGVLLGSAVTRQASSRSGLKSKMSKATSTPALMPGEPFHPAAAGVTGSPKRGGSGKGRDKKRRSLSGALRAPLKAASKITSRMRRSSSSLNLKGKAPSSSPSTSSPFKRSSSLPTSSRSPLKHSSSRTAYSKYETPEGSANDLKGLCERLEEEEEKKEEEDGDQSIKEFEAYLALPPALPNLDAEKGSRRSEETTTPRPASSQATEAFTLNGVLSSAVSPASDASTVDTYFKDVLGSDGVRRPTYELSTPVFSEPLLEGSGGPDGGPEGIAAPLLEEGPSPSAGEALALSPQRRAPAQLWKRDHGEADEGAVDEVQEIAAGWAPLDGAALPTTGPGERVVTSWAAFKAAPACASPASSPKKRSHSASLATRSPPKGVPTVLNVPPPSPASSTFKANQEEQNRRRFNEALDRVLKGREEGNASTPEGFYGSYMDFSFKSGNDEDHSNDDNNGDDGNDEEGATDVSELADLFEVMELDDSLNEDAVPDVSCWATTSGARDAFIPLGGPAATENKKAADSALAWTALAAILSSPAPATAVSKAKSTPANLWGAGNRAEMPEISEHESASLCGDVPKEDADTVVSRTVLGMLLGSPRSSPTIAGADKCLEDPTENIQSNDASDDPLPDICDQGEGAACASIDAPDCLSTGSIDLGELADGDEVVDVEATARQEACPKEGADSVLAWSALGMLLGSPAPKPLALNTKKGRKGTSKNLWEDECEAATEDDLNNLLPEIGEEVEDGSAACEDEMPKFDDIQSATSETSDQEDRLSAASIDMKELADASEEVDVAQGSCHKESADSVLAWSALGMILGTPAPKSVSKKKVKNSSSKNLWDDGTASSDVELDGLLDAVELECTDVEGIPTSVAYDEEDIDTHSIPSLSGTSDFDSSSTRSTSQAASCQGDSLASSPERQRGSKKEITDSVLAWGAFAALMGAPAPKAALPSKRRKARDLWCDEGADVADDLSDVQSLTDIWEVRTSPVKRSPCSE